MGPSPTRLSESKPGACFRHGLQLQGCCLGVELGRAGSDPQGDCRSLKGCHLAHLELPSDARLIIYDSWDGPRNLWKRRNLCWNSAHMGGAGHGEPGREALCKSGSHGYSSICPGAEGGAAGHTRAQAPSALKAGRGWWPALVSALPHLKPHVGI